MLMLCLRPEWTSRRPKTMDLRGSSYLIMVNPQWVAWLHHPFVRLQPNHCKLQTTKYPIKHSSDEYQMCNCGSLWTQGENLQLSKSILEFYTQGVWSHTIKVRSFDRGFSSGRGFTFGTDLITCNNTSKTELLWRSKTIMFSSLVDCASIGACKCACSLHRLPITSCLIKCGCRMPFNH